MSSAQQLPGVGVGIDDAPLTAFHKRLTLYSSGGPFLDGFVIATLGVTLAQIGPQFGLRPGQEGMLGASILIGMFLGAYAGGWLTDRFGRKTLYTVDLIAIVVCSVLQFWVDDFTSLFLLRLAVGVAIGADYPIATALLTEFIPRKSRGPLISLLMVSLFVGGALAPVVGEVATALAGDQSWRWTLASAALPAAILIPLRRGTPESPRWLVARGRVDEAIASVRKAFGSNVTIDPQTLLPQDSAGGARRLLRSGYLGRILFITAFWTCSLVPVYALFAFGSTILALLSLDGAYANYGSAAINLLFLVGCLVAATLINKLGRRVLLITSFLFSGLALLALGVFPQAPASIVLALFAAYAVFIGGAQVLQWVYPNELFPTDIRASAVGLCSTLSRIGGAVGIYLVPIMLNSTGIATTMLAATALTFAGMIYSIAAAPETRGATLEQSSSLATRNQAPDRTERGLASDSSAA